MTHYRWGFWDAAPSPLILPKVFRNSRCTFGSGCRSRPARATRFVAERAEAQQNARVLASYDALIHDPDIDIIYIATTHQNHVALARAALTAGKAVLVEKPMGLHTQEVSALIAHARQNKAFLMEGMWMRFIPAFRHLQQTLAQQLIGPVSLVQADFGIDLPATPEGRMLNPQIGGGSLWDLGIYPLTFASLVYGSTPSAMSAFTPQPRRQGWMSKSS